MCDYRYHATRISHWHWEKSSRIKRYIIYCMYIRCRKISPSCGECKHTHVYIKSQKYEVRYLKCELHTIFTVISCSQLWLTIISASRLFSFFTVSFITRFSKNKLYFRVYSNWRINTRFNTSSTFIGNICLRYANVAANLVLCDNKDI